MNKKLWCLLAIPLLLLPGIVAGILYISDTGLPSGVSAYSEIAVSCPDGSTILYSSQSSAFAVFDEILDDCTRLDLPRPAGCSVFTVLFLSGRQEKAFELLISGDKTRGYIITSKNALYEIGESALRAFLTSRSAQALYLGELPPKVSIWDAVLTPHVVEWYETLPSGEKASSGQYITQNIKPPYLLSLSLLTQIVFEREPSRTEVTVYRESGKETRCPLADFDPTVYPEGEPLTIVLVAEWENGNGEAVKAGYSFQYPVPEKTAN